ncbi:MAG: hypothetical protein VB036_14160 [Propionicimonas sp.]|nr:hypothetical protein [Propionicimonas sp.]
MGEREIPFAEDIDRAKKYVVSSTLSWWIARSSGRGSRPAIPAHASSGLT